MVMCRLNYIHLWSEKYASSDTCKSLIRWNASFDAMMRSIIVLKLLIIKVGTVPIFRMERLVVNTYSVRLFTSTTLLDLYHSRVPCAMADGGCWSPDDDSQNALLTVVD